MKVFQSNSFGRKVKKFRKKEKEELDKAVKKLVSDPDIGTEKKGDLKGYLYTSSQSVISNIF